ncbi:MAG: class I SAM-dependent methyltransferase, partial [Candidatus Odinarchaeota archaeon]
MLITIYKIIDNKYNLSRRSKAIDKGERIIVKDWDSTKNSGNINKMIHIKRYEWVKNFVRNLKVLDNGCGTGYGTYFLAKNQVKEILGIDISIEAIKYAQRNYHSHNLQFKQMDSLSLKFLNAHYDAVISFDVIEHIDEQFQEKFLSEIVRVIKENGILIISCPNEDSANSYNPHHKNELNRKKLENLLKLFFMNVKLYGMKFIINNINLKEKWKDYINDIRYSNIIIEKEPNSSFNLIAL